MKCKPAGNQRGGKVACLHRLAKVRRRHFGILLCPENPVILHQFTVTSRDFGMAAGLGLCVGRSPAVSSAAKAEYAKSDNPAFQRHHWHPVVGPVLRKVLVASCDTVGRHELPISAPSTLRQGK
jgi:hypothetical protein